MQRGRSPATMNSLLEDAPRNRDRLRRRSRQPGQEDGRDPLVGKGWFNLACAGTARLPARCTCSATPRRAASRPTARPLKHADARAADRDAEGDHNGGLLRRRPRVDRGRDRGCGRTDSGQGWFQYPSADIVAAPDSKGILEAIRGPPNRRALPEPPPRRLPEPPAPLSGVDTSAGATCRPSNGPSWSRSARPRRSCTRRHRPDRHRPDRDRLGADTAVRRRVGRSVDETGGQIARPAPRRRRSLGEQREACGRREVLQSGRVQPRSARRACGPGLPARRRRSRIPAPDSTGRCASQSAAGAA